jgi:hypothetical protein
MLLEEIIVVYFILRPSILLRETSMVNVKYSLPQTWIDKIRNFKCSENIATFTSQILDFTQ